MIFINPNLPPKIEGLKDSYLDIKAQLKDGTLVIIEIQVLNVQSFGKARREVGDRSIPNTS